MAKWQVGAETSTCCAIVLELEEAAISYDFPASPTENQEYTPPVGGQTYIYKAPRWTVKAAVTATAQARNRIVNPAMQISQENGTAAGTTIQYYMADQWVLGVTTTGAVSGLLAQSSATAQPFVSRCRITVTTADTSIAAGEFLSFFQRIEGTRIRDLQWGGAGAVQVVLRFGFKGPAGTYHASFRNGASTRSYVAPFTISAGQANTDTIQTLVIPGDVTGTWEKTTAIGIDLWIALAAGSTYNGGTANAWAAGGFMASPTQSNGLGVVNNIFELWDVGFYADPNNTGLPPPWQMPDEADELQACMRYWQTFYGINSYTPTSGGSYYMFTSCLAPYRPGGVLTGTNVTASNFGTTVGTLGTFPNGARELRAATVTASQGTFGTQYIINGRM